MAKSLNPQNVSKTVWYYENDKTLEFIVECRNELGIHHQTLRFLVPISKLTKSIRRCYKKRGASDRQGDRAK